MDLLLFLLRLGIGYEVGCREIRVDKLESFFIFGLESFLVRVI